jgi:hypothetical protein
MKSKRSGKVKQKTVLEGNWIDTDDLVKDGESKEIWEGVWVSRAPWVVLDPPEPIKKPGKSKAKKKSA